MTLYKSLQLVLGKALLVFVGSMVDAVMQNDLMLLPLGYADSGTRASGVEICCFIKTRIPPGWHRVCKSSHILLCCP